MKRNNRGEVSGLVIGLLVALAFGAIVTVSLIAGYIGFGNDANRQENGIVASYTNNKNVYDNGWKTVVEKAQVPGEYTDKLKEIYTDTMKGRYGADGSKALLQFIKEQNPTIDASVYKEIQQSVEVFHTQFAQAQTELVSRKQEYQNLYTATTSGRLYNMIAHYPHIDMTKYDIVTSAKTETDFDTKQAPTLDIFGKKK
jgi:hypothetical protein